MLLPLALYYRTIPKECGGIAQYSSISSCLASGKETHFFFFISGAVSHLYPTKSTIPIAEISCSTPNREGVNRLQLSNLTTISFQEHLGFWERAKYSKLMLGLTTSSDKAILVSVLRYGLDLVCTRFGNGTTL